MCCRALLLPFKSHRGRDEILVLYLLLKTGGEDVDVATRSHGNQLCGEILDDVWRLVMSVSHLWAMILVVWNEAQVMALSIQGGHASGLITRVEFIHQDSI